jgi:hypothetical protein
MSNTTDKDKKAHSFDSDDVNFCFDVTYVYNVFDSNYTDFGILFICRFFLQNNHF